MCIVGFVLCEVGILMIVWVEKIYGIIGGGVLEY